MIYFEIFFSVISLCSYAIKFYHKFLEHILVFTIFQLFLSGDLEFTCSGMGSSPGSVFIIKVNRCVYCIEVLIIHCVK